MPNLNDDDTLSAATAHIAQRGCNTLGIDMYERTQSKGSSQGRSRIIRLAYYEDHRCKLWNDFTTETADAYEHSD